MATKWDNENFVINEIMRMSRGRSYEDYYIFASDRLKNDREFIMNIVRLKPKVYRYLESQFRDDEEILESALSGESGIYKYASDRLRDDYRLTELAIDKYGYNIKHASDRLRNDFSLGLKAVMQNGEYIELLSERLRNLDEIAKAALARSPGSIIHFPPALINNPMYLEMVLDSKESLYGLRPYNLPFTVFNETITGNRELMLKLITKAPDYFGELTPAYQNDRDFVIAALKSREFSLQRVPQKFWGDIEIVKIALEVRSSDFKFVSEELKKDVDVCAIALAGNSDLLKYVDKKMRKDKRIIIALIKSKYIRDLSDIPSNLSEDRDVIIAAAKSFESGWSGLSIKKVAEQFRDDIEIVTIALLKDFAQFNDISERLKNDKNFLLHVSEKLNYQHSRTFLEYVPKDLLDDIEIIKAFIPKDNEAFKNASARLRDDRALALYALEKNNAVYEYCSDTLKKDRELVLLALRNNSKLFPLLVDSYRDDVEFVKVAVEKDSGNVKYVSERLKNDVELMFYAFSANYFSLAHVGEKLYTDKSFIKAVLTSDKYNYEYKYDWPLRGDLEFMKEVIEINPEARVVVVFEKMTATDFKAWLGEELITRFSEIIPSFITKYSSPFDLFFFVLKNGEINFKDISGSLSDYSEPQQIIILENLRQEKYKQLKDIVKSSLEEKNSTLLEIMFRRQLVDGKDINTYTELARATNDPLIISLFFDTTSGEKSQKDAVKEIRVKLLARLKVAKKLTANEKDEIIRFFNDDEEIMALAVKIDPPLFYKGSERIQTNIEMERDVHRRDLSYLKKAGMHIIDDEIFAKELVTINGSAYEFLSPRLQKNVEIVAIAIENNIKMLDLVPWSIPLEEEQIIIGAVNGFIKANFALHYGGTLRSSIVIRRELLMSLLAVKRDPRYATSLVKKYAEDPVFIKASTIKEKSDKWENILDEALRCFILGAKVETAEGVINCNSDGYVKVGDEVIIDKGKGLKGRVIITRPLPYDHSKIETAFISEITKSVNSDYIGPCNVKDQLTFNPFFIFELLTEDCLATTNRIFEYLVNADAFWKKIIEEHYDFSLNDLPPSVKALFTDFLENRQYPLEFPRYLVEVKVNSGEVLSYNSRVNVRVGDVVRLDGKFSEGIVLSYELGSNNFDYMKDILSNKTLDEALAANKVKKFGLIKKEAVVEEKIVTETEETLSVELKSEPDKKEGKAKLVFAATGKFNTFTRDSLKAFIEENGHVLLDKISKNANYLINNDLESVSSKNKFAKDNNIVIISEEELIKLIG